MPKILLIEDVEVVRKVVHKMLNRLGHQVDDAIDGVDGLSKLKQSSYDLVITDIWMPGIDGISFIRQVRQHDPHLKILAFSGGAPRASAVYSLSEAKTTGANAILMKPVDRQELEQAIQEVIGSK
ncbi:putative two-component response transcriptional regulator (CheY family) [Azospirillaceae bacterium]